MPTTLAAATSRCCRWPPADADPDDHLHDPAGFPLCGEPTEAPGKSYCRKHLAVAHAAEFVEAQPLLKNICRDDTEALDMIDRAVRRPHGGDRSGKSDNVPLAKRGNARDAALRRLRDHRPDLHAKVLAGDISPHAAMR